MTEPKYVPQKLLAAKRLQHNSTEQLDWQCAVEVPIALVFNGVSYAVMMVSPNDLGDYVRGFVLSEAIVPNSQDIGSVSIDAVDAGLVARVDIPAKALDRLLERRRNLVGQASCGLCGIEDLEAALRPLPKVGHSLTVRRDAIFKALQGLPERQVLNQETGGVHGAAFISREGEIELLREDVGRHNALDKLIGAMDRSNMDVRNGFVLLTSRCSFELVQKAISFGVGLLVTISTPTSLAVEIAKEHGLGLISLARSDALLVMNDPTGQFT